VNNVQLDRFTGDTFQTGGATTTRYKERKFTEIEKKNPHLLPYFKKHEWLIGNNAFTESTIPTIRAHKPLTGTGTCQLPSTVQSLCTYFADEVSKVVFTDHLRLANIPKNLSALHDYSEATAFLMDHKPYWMQSIETCKEEWVRSPLFEWISFRLNWAYYKRDVIRRLYDKQLSSISTGIYTNNTRFSKRESGDDIHTIPSAEDLQRANMNSPYAKFFEILQNEMVESNVTVLNVTLRSTSLPVLSHLYDPYISRDELSSNIIAASNDAQKQQQMEEDTQGGDASNPKLVANHTTFTHHRYWALYYIRLLEEFIESHSALCRAMLREDKEPTAFILQPTPPAETKNVETLVKQYHVPTQYHPYDELAATWKWEEIQGHQSSRAILAERYPDEFIFRYPLVYLYHIMAYKLPHHVISGQLQTTLRGQMRALALSVQKQWHEFPLLPRDLLQGGTAWSMNLKAEPFAPGSIFMWTVFAVVGRIEQLRRLIVAGDPNHPQEEDEKDFYLHTIQVRLTGYFPITRWMMAELLLHEQPDILDTRLTEAVEYYNCDEIDFDGEQDMPNFATIIHLLNYWHTANKNATKNPIVGALQKGLPFKSLSRVLSDHFANETEANPHFITLAMLFVMVTSLGLFRRQQGAPPMYRPCFSSMAKIDFALLQTPKQMFNFIHVTNSKILIYMSREVLVHTIAQAPHYRDHQIIDWQKLEQNTWQVSNDIRRYLHHYKFWLKAPFNKARLNLEEEIKLNYEKSYSMFLFPQHDFLHTTLHVFHSLHVKHLDKVILLQMNLKHLSRDLLAAAPSMTSDEIDELKGKIQRTQLELTAITYELSEETRNIIWQTLIGKRDNFDIWTFIRQWLSDEDILLFHRLHEQYDNHTSEKKLELTASQFSLSAFTMIHYLLTIQKQLKQFRLQPLPLHMAQSIHDTMRNRTHHLSPEQPLFSTAYDVHVTLCCNQVITLHDTDSYGNSHLMYDRNLRYYACCRKITKKTGYTGSGGSPAPASKKTKKSKALDSDDGSDEDDAESGEEEGKEDEEDIYGSDDEDMTSTVTTDAGDTFNVTAAPIDPSERKLLKKIQNRKKRLTEINEATRKSIEKDKKRQMTNLVEQTRTGKNITMDDYPQMTFKERRKIVCRLDMDTKPLVCVNHPPVLTLNLMGQSLSYGSEYSKMVTYQHCPRCGDLHTFSLKLYNGGQGYMCANCTQKSWAPSLEMQRSMFCVYCGRQHFKNVHHGLELVATVDIGDVNNPVKLLNYCYADKPKYKPDFYYDREAEHPHYILFLDTYLNRHTNIMHVHSMAQFPYQNTKEEDDREIPMAQNGFSWPLYGQRLNDIPQLVDVWWPPMVEPNHITVPKI
jgi:hypothetical protein